MVLGQRQVPDKKGEGGQVDALLAPLDAAGMVFTLDALHTTKKTARLITQDLGAHYVLVLKGNQPSALAAARAALAGVNADWVASSAVEDDRGLRYRRHGAEARRGPGHKRSGQTAATSEPTGYCAGSDVVVFSRVVEVPCR